LNYLFGEPEAGISNVLNSGIITGNVQYHSYCMRIILSYANIVLIYFMVDLCCRKSSLVERKKPEMVH